MKGCLLLKGEDMKSGDVIDVNKRYRITCPYCGKIQYTCLSIAHMWGIANGGQRDMPGMQKGYDISV